MPEHSWPGASPLLWVPSPNELRLSQFMAHSIYCAFTVNLLCGINTSLTRTDEEPDIGIFVQCSWASLLRFL